MKRRICCESRVYGGLHVTKIVTLIYVNTKLIGIGTLRYISVVTAIHQQKPIGKGYSKSQGVFIRQPDRRVVIILFNLFYNRIQLAAS
ncbi:TPA: hypothetical protein QCY05_002627 [Bacillus wiedmannii]|nr:hypothetical protein [Bacillus wiedmannii]